MRSRVRRGEIYWTEFDPVVGAEMGKTRPSLVVQNDAGNAFGRTTIVATITSRSFSKAYPFMVSLPVGTLPRPSIINCAHVRTVDLSRVKPGMIARLDEATMREVDNALRGSLGIS